MSKNLIIVESPAKARTMERYLGREFSAIASYGHVRDLVHSGGRGVDVNNGFSPCLLYTSPSPRDATLSRMPSSA